jgi:hypothetical protein
MEQLARKAFSAEQSAPGHTLVDEDWLNAECCSTLAKPLTTLHPVPSGGAAGWKVNNFGV